MGAPSFVLKTTPPKASRTSLARERLAQVWSDVHDRTAVVVQAPPGFGKTTLLGQWRRAWLERGAFVAWLTVDAQDDPARFVEGLLHALRVSTARTAFDTIARQYGGQPGAALDALTALLAEVATAATPTVLVLDDAERLPETTAGEALAYLLHNAPPNLHVLLGTRTPLALSLADLAARGGAAMLTAEDLRLRLDEALAILERRFGARLGIDDCARLHELTEGWPIALQLAASAIEREPDLHAAIESLSARHGDLSRYFMESLLARLPAALADFLTRVSILDAILPDLCGAVTGRASATADLEQLMRATPIMIGAEGHGWLRLHALARDFLLGRFEELPADERRALHGRAARWFAERELYFEAARHAAASGNEPLAQSYAARCLFGIVKEGRLREARDWIERLPDSMIAADTRLRLTGAWILAIGDCPGEALRVAEGIAAEAGASEATRCEAALIGATAAAFCDLPGRVAKLLAPWRPPLPLADPAFTVSQLNLLSFVELSQGATEQVRRLQSQSANDAVKAGSLLAFSVGRLFVGLSYLWEGNAVRAEAVLRPALERAERDMGRRSPAAAMFAAALAAALLERDQLAAAQALLANRLDVIERTGLPDANLLAHRTLAYLALGQGDERRALEVLKNLHAQGEARRMPGLRLTSLAEQVRIHALRARHETARALLAALDDLAPAFEHEDLATFEPLYRLQAAIANAYAALAASDFDRAAATLERAGTLAARLHRGRDALVVKVLRAVLMHQSGVGDARELRAEALGLAAIEGLDRLAADTHPLAAAIRGQSSAAPRQPARPPVPAPPAAAEGRAIAITGGILTPKEAEVLQLLNARMPNKLIARALDISDETAKWHVKNLFSKLNAGTRRHAVDRARLLGLVVG